MLAFEAGQMIAPAGDPPVKTPTQAEIQKMRQDLQALQRRREEHQRTLEMIPWRETTDAPAGSLGIQGGLVRLVNEMDQLRGYWTFRPMTLEGTVGQEPVRVLLCLKENLWLALPAGRWEIDLTVGFSEHARPLRLAPRQVTINKYGRYELAITERVERRLKGMIKQRESEIPMKPMMDRPPSAQSKIK